MMIWSNEMLHKMMHKMHDIILIYVFTVLRNQYAHQIFER